MWQRQFVFFGVLLSWQQNALAVHKDNISIQYNKDYAMGTHIKIKVNDLIKEMKKPGLFKPGPSCSYLIIRVTMLKTVLLLLQGN
ncbi:hypothetical protein PJIAN_1564 [Paludibacter jiangxiensis]|uniref:Uncharacterized protein n=1 Tax=Paludibacter jiangxiensis TaxID=681398 RepID=A0A170YQ93_9BACT|nr:hypothetical protein PJIAN_1564 [Paludibacter jiangxiensis]